MAKYTHFEHYAYNYLFTLILILFFIFRKYGGTSLQLDLSAPLFVNSFMRLQRRSFICRVWSCFAGFGASLRRNPLRPTASALRSYS